MLQDKTIFFSRSPLLQTLALTDAKASPNPPPPPPPPVGVFNNESLLYTPIWISTRRRNDRLDLLEALIWPRKFLQKLYIKIKISTALKTQSLLQDNIVLEYRKDLLPHIHVTLPAMSTKIVLVVLSTCLIRLLISSSVSGFPSTNSFLRLGSSLTTSSFFSWLFLKSTSWSPFNHRMLLGRKDNLLSFTFRHVKLSNGNKYKPCRFNKLL